MGDVIAGFDDRVLWNIWLGRIWFAELAHDPPVSIGNPIGLNWLRIPARFCLVASSNIWFREFPFSLRCALLCFQHGRSQLIIIKRLLNWLIGWERQRLAK